MSARVVCGSCGTLSHIGSRCHAGMALRAGAAAGAGGKGAGSASGPAAWGRHDARRGRGPPRRTAVIWLFDGNASAAEPATLLYANTSLE